MSSCAVTLTANAGVVLEWRSHVIWVDALHAIFCCATFLLQRTTRMATWTPLSAPPGS